jgi:class 3 adenylate cyclase
MSNQREPFDRYQPIVQELIDEHVRVSGDIISIDSSTWAIHGFIAVDGDILMAEFDSPDEATAAIEEIRAGVAQPRPLADLF